MKIDKAMGAHINNEDLIIEEAYQQIPKYGWKVKLNHTFPEYRDADIPLKWSMVQPMMPLFLRYSLWYTAKFIKQEKPYMDFRKRLQCQQIYGVPLGGIGSGTIGRGFRGEFCRFQVRPGIYEHSTVDANQFIVTVLDEDNRFLYQNVLSVKSPPGGEKLSAWKWNFPADKAEYVGLYPRSWTTYEIPGQNIELICQQISPVIPHNYKDSCLPVGIFLWTVINKGKSVRKVSITFTFKNGAGTPSIDNKGNAWTQAYRDKADRSIAGVMIHQNIGTLRCSYVLAGRLTEDVDVSIFPGFDPTKSGEELWNILKKKGNFAGDLTHESSLTIKNATNVTKHKHIAGAINCQTIVPGKSYRVMEMCLVWDMPIIQFGRKMTKHDKRYTRWFGKNENAGTAIARYAFANYQNWMQDIEGWQNPILHDRNLPDWYKSALFNELYYISDGGTIWLEMHEDEELSVNDARREFGRFGILEGHEYRMYNTYDVYYYASIAVVMLWPKLQLSVQYEFRNAINYEDPGLRFYLLDGKRCIRKPMNCVPHDLGDPAEEPFTLINAYHVHDSGEWKDLNLKFILLVYRDFVHTADMNYLEDMWPCCLAVMEKSESWDKDGDGLIENSGFPDQTYDSWVMTGPSAYCGGLWLSALYCMSRMAKSMNHPDISSKYKALLTSAAEAYHKKLWNGKYYKFDCSGGEYGDTIMADQLSGYWSLCMGLKSDCILPRDNIKMALSTVYQNNILKVRSGTIGAVNGCLSNGKISEQSFASQEIWTGVTYSIAALMIHEGMFKEGFEAAEGIYRTVYERTGLGYQTPEALLVEQHYRSLGYMRPLSIWGIQYVWEQAQGTRS